MAEKAAEPGESTWLVEPPAGGQVHLALGLGKGVKVTPELRSKLEGVLTALLEGESLSATDPFMCGGAFNRCGTFSCTLDKCTPLKNAPCYQLVSCRIDVQ